MQLLTDEEKIDLELLSSDPLFIYAHMYEERIFIAPLDHHEQLLLKYHLVSIPVKISDYEDTLVTFMCATGFPGYLYLSESTKKSISSRIINDKFGEYILLNDKRIKIHKSPSKYRNCDIMGLTMLNIIGMTVTPDNIRFLNKPTHI